MSIDDILMSLSGAMPQAAVTGGAIGNGPLYDPAKQPPVDDPAADVRAAYAGTYQPPAPQMAPTTSGPPRTQAELQAEADAHPQPPTEVAGLEVTAKRNPPPEPKISAPLTAAQLDNSGDVMGAQESLAKANLAAQAHPSGYAQGGSDNPGVFGMLPQGMQHGTLRNVIGAIGDAFLVGSGRQPAYEERMQRQSLGNAMAGIDVNNPDSIRAAATRMAVSGVPGAADQAQKLLEQSAQLQLRKTIQDQTMSYRGDQIRVRQDGAIRQMTPYIGGMVQGAKTKDDYAAMFQRAETMAQRIGPDVHASDFGIPNPEDWQPGMTATTGATTGQVMHNATSQDSIQERREAASQTSQDRRRGQDMTAGNVRYSVNHRSGPQMNSTSFLRNLMAIPEDQRTPEQQNYVTRMTQPTGRGRGGGRGLPGTMGATGAGGRPIPTPQQLMEVLKHPETAASFNAHFFGTH